MGDTQDVLVLGPIVDQKFLIQIHVILQRHVHAAQVGQHLFGFLLVAADDHRTAHLAGLTPLVQGAPVMPKSLNTGISSRADSVLIASA
jgi:hypothetical protein